MQGRLLDERRPFQGQAFESPPQVAHARVVEPGADVPDVVQFVAAPVAEQQRAQGLARALALRVAPDHELRALHRLDLEPCPRATPRAIRAVLALGDDAFEAAVERRRVEPFGVVRRVHELDVGRRQQALRQVPAPVDVRVATQVEAREVQQVEAQQDHARLALRFRDLLRVLQSSTVLQRIERRPARGIERDQFAVEDHPVDRLRGEVGRDLGERTRQVDPATRLQPNRAVLDEGDHAVAVELGFVRPLGIGARHIADLREHRVHRLRHRLCGAGGCEALGVDLRDRNGRRTVLDRAARQHRLRARQHVVLLREPVLVLDQQPLPGRRGAHQRKRTLELLAPQEKAQLAVGQLLAQARLRLATVTEGVLLALIRRIHAAVPDDDVTRAVFLFGDDALERRVIERVVFDLDREPLVGRV